MELWRFQRNMYGINLDRVSEIFHTALSCWDEKYGNTTTNNFTAL